MVGKFYKYFPTLNKDLNGGLNVNLRSLFLFLQNRNLFFDKNPFSSSSSKKLKGGYLWHKESKISQYNKWCIEDISKKEVVSKNSLKNVSKRGIWNLCNQFSVTNWKVLWHKCYFVTNLVMQGRAFYLIRCIIVIVPNPRIPRIC